MSDPLGYDPEHGYTDAPYVPDLNPLALPPMITQHPPTPTYPSLIIEEPSDPEPPAGS